jgi:hypothetical protein
MVCWWAANFRCNIYTHESADGQAACAYKKVMLANGAPTHVLEAPGMNNQKKFHKETPTYGHSH